jgi:hypothetical protein
LNRPGAKASEVLREFFRLTGMQGSIRGEYEPVQAEDDLPIAANATPFYRLKPFLTRLLQISRCSFSAVARSAGGIPAESCIVVTGGVLMFTHDAEYFRQSLRVQDISAREPLSAAEFPRHTTEQRRLEQLPWPRNLFGELATIAELMAESEATVPASTGVRISSAATAG